MSCQRLLWARIGLRSHHPGQASCVSFVPKNCFNLWDYKIVTLPSRRRGLALYARLPREPRRCVANELHDVRARPRDLALGDAAHSHRLDEIVDRTGGDALHIGLLHHGGDAFSAIRCGTTKAGKQDPLRNWGCAVRWYRRGSPSHGRGSRCAEHGARSSSCRGRRRSVLRPPVPSAAGRKSRLSLSRSASGFSSTSMRSIITSSVIGGASNQVGLNNPTLPATHPSPPPR